MLAVNQKKKMVWLALWVGKMRRILSCHWLPWAQNFATYGMLAVNLKKNCMADSVVGKMRRILSCHWLPEQARPTLPPHFSLLCPSRKDIVLVV